MNALARQAKHREGLDFLYRGQVAEAIQTFSDAKDLYGEHVGLLVDLSKAYYTQGDIEQAQRIHQLLEEEYLAAEPLLSEESKVQTLIYLAKMREESGELLSAYNALDSALEFCGDDNGLRLQVMEQSFASARPPKV